MKLIPAKTIIRITAKIIGIVAVILGLTLILTIFLQSMVTNFFSGLNADQEEENYVVKRLSAESNARGDDEKYIFRQGKKILCYSLKTEELEEYDINLPEGERITWNATVGSHVYYVLSNHIVRRFDCKKQIDKEVLSEEDIRSICDLEHWTYLFVTSSGQNLVLDIDDSFFICPADGDLKTDCIGVNTLFSEEDKTGGEQIIRYRGMRIGRRYDVKKERYQIIDIWEEKDGRSLFPHNERYTIKSGETQVILNHTRDYRDYSYQVEGTLREQRIRCLNVSAYEHSHIQGNKLTTENGDIIGLVHVPRESCYDSFDPSQDDLKYDALFRLNPQTGENSILYKTENNCTRIIGYQDGVIYLLRDFKIYSSIMESREEKLIAELPEDTYYEFDWQGDYLIVINQNGIYGAYKVR